MKQQASVIAENARVYNKYQMLRPQKYNGTGNECETTIEIGRSYPGYPHHKYGEMRAHASMC